MDTNTLIQTGLSTNQAKVYLALLKTGATKAGTIVNSTGMKRGLIYKTLEELIMIDLAEKKGDGETVAKFFPKHPAKLRDFVEQKKKTASDAAIVLDGVLPSLVSQFNIVSGQPGITVCEGLEGVEKVLNDSLSNPEEVVYTYGDIESVMRYIPDISLRYVKKREQLGIEKKVMLLDAPKAREFMRNYHRVVTEVKFIVPEASPFKSVMEIYNGKVSYITFGENTMIGVIIDDATIYTMHRTIFEFFWKKLEPTKKENYSEDV